MKIDFPGVIFSDEPQATFDRSNGKAKELILSNLDVPVAKRRYQEGGRVMIWATIADKTIIEPLLINELNGTVLTIAILWTRFSLHDTSPSLLVSKWSVYLRVTGVFLMCISLHVNSLSLKDL